MSAIRCTFGATEMTYTTQQATEYGNGIGPNGTGKRQKVTGWYVLNGERRIRAFTGKDAEQKAADWAKFCEEHGL